MDCLLSVAPFGCGLNFYILAEHNRYYEVDVERTFFYDLRGELSPPFGLKHSIHRTFLCNFMNPNPLRFYRGLSTK